MTYRFFIRFIALLVSYFGVLSLSHAQFDPDLDWHTIETNHFLFHYHDGLEDHTRQLIAKSEAIHREVTNYFDWIPKAKTHVILNDHFDITNASATPFPNNTIHLFMSSPSELTSLEDYEDWMELVFKHEYVHIVHLDKAKDFPYHARSFLGRFPLFFPNIFSPRWITEGIATYLETDHEKGFGRGQSNYFRGMMRNELINGFKPLNVVNQNILDWPSGTAAYLYGVYFYNFLRDEYGEETIQNYFDLYSEFPIPYFINTIARQATGKTMHSLWIEFEFYLYSQFSDEISQARFSEPKNSKITNSGYFSGFSKTLENGNIVLVKGDFEHIKTLEEFNPNNQESRIITTLPGQSVVFGQPFDYHPQRGILMPIIDFRKNTHLNFDLYQIDLQSGDKQQLTQGQRYIRAIWSPGGDRIIAVKNHLGKHSLELLNNNGTLIKTLWPAEQKNIFLSIAWSPNGNQIIASMRDQRSPFNLALFDLETEQWRAITRNDWIEAHPSFNSDGSKIYYSADYDGIYNIYELDITTRDLYKLTNTPTIALYPNVNEVNNSLYFAELGKNGFDTVSQQSDLYYQYKDTLLLESNIPQLAAMRTDVSSDMNVSQPEDYNGLSYLAPSAWIPLYSSDNFHKSILVTTWSNDPLNRHNYYATLEADIENSDFLWNVNYTYARFYPLLNISTRNENFYGNNFYYINETDYTVTLLYPHLKMEQQWIGYLSYKKLFAELNSISDRNRTLDEDTDEIFSVGISRNSSRQPGFAVSPHSGNFLSLAYENNNTEASDYDLHSRVIANAVYFSPLIYRSVFELGALAIAAGSEAGILRLGGRERNSGDTLQPGKRSYGLRGYGASEFTGTNLQKIEMVMHIPIAKPQRGIMSPPFGLTRIDLHPFAITGRTGFFSTINDESWSSSVGVELSADVNFGYGAWPFFFTTGVAKGLNANGITHYWVEFSAEF